LGELRDEPQVLLRFRTLEQARISGAWVNGEVWSAVDAAKGDVNLSGLQGRVEVEVGY
jgi:hypothetical protein